MAEEEENTNTLNGKESPETEEEGKLESSGGNLASPEGILMLSVAVIIDVISFIPFLNFASWVVGVIFIGGWYAFFHTKQTVKAAGGKIWLRILILLGVEVIPVLSIFPTWTWFVYKTLKET